jgi:hypothetical protein
LNWLKKGKTPLTKLIYLSKVHIKTNNTFDKVKLIKSTTAKHAKKYNKTFIDREQSLNSLIASITESQHFLLALLKVIFIVNEKEVGKLSIGEVNNSFFELSDYLHKDGFIFENEKDSLLAFNKFRNNIVHLPKSYTLTILNEDVLNGLIDAVKEIIDIISLYFNKYNNECKEVIVNEKDRHGNKIFDEIEEVTNAIKNGNFSIRAKG